MAPGYGCKSIAKKETSGSALLALLLIPNSFAVLGVFFGAAILVMLRIKALAAWTSADPPQS